MRRGVAVLLGLCIVASSTISSSTLAAQAHDHGGSGLVAGSVLGGLWTAGGDDFDGVDTGLGLEFLGRYIFPSGLSLGVGLGRAYHNVNGFTNNLEITSLAGEVRFELDGGFPALRPFVGVRAAFRSWLIRVPSGAFTAEATANGLGLGGLAGLEFIIGPALSVEAAAHGGLMRFGDASIAGFTGTDTSLSGHSIGIQVGVSMKRSLF
jgi:hypothetical protein